MPSTQARPPIRPVVSAALLAALVMGVMLSSCPVAAGTLVLDFESVPPRDIALGEGFWFEQPGFSTEGASFSGGSYQGFVVSTSTVTGTGGYFYAQQFGAESAAAEISAESNDGSGGGVDGGKFAVGYNAGSTIDMPAGYRPTSVFATNTATTAWLLANTDPNNFTTPLQNNGEEFRVIFRGWSQAGGLGTQIGSVAFVLGRYASDTRTIVTDWTLVDLTGLGEAASISLDFVSYDENAWGIVTPTYVAIDNLTLTAVPEPGTWALLAGAAGVVGCGGVVRRRRVR